MSNGFIERISKLESELERKNIEIDRLKKEIETEVKNFNDKMACAYQIQKAMLTPIEILDNTIPENFILYKPKDFLSGDFYWMRRIESENKIIIVVGDCMGHSIPGAFISILAISTLNNIVTKNNIYSPDLILTELRMNLVWELQQTLRGKDNESVDLAILTYDYVDKKLLFSGAKRKLYQYTEGELKTYEGDKMAVGFYPKMKEFSQTIYRYEFEEFMESFDSRNQKFSYKLEEIPLSKGDIIYLFSDGYVSQIGGEQQKVFGTPEFKNLLKEIHNLPVNEQKELLNKAIEYWKGEEEQTDDIIVVGLRFS
jgi:phosphoserine phosphatase RsbU/P